MNIFCVRMGLYRSTRRRRSPFSFSLLVSLCLLLGVGFALNVPCKTGWSLSEVSGSCVKLSTDEKSWENARDSCRAEQSDLVKILDKKMKTFIKDLMGSVTDSVYIGLKLRVNSFKWLDESSRAGYRSGIGKRDNGKQCARMDKREKWTWGNCSTPLKYFCEKGPGLCPREWLPSAQSGTCIKIWRNRKNWADAREYCKTQGGDLVIIKDRTMNTFLWDQIRDDSWRGYWTGLNDRVEENKFVWLDYVEEATFTYWDKDEPNNSDEEDCVQLNYREAIIKDSWHDLHCTDRTHYVCEKFADCANEKYGMLCPRNCSSVNCLCNRRTGDCSGCHVDYKGPTCDVCAFGRYGRNCSEMCSPNCAGEGTCDYRDGYCLKGCLSGFEGGKCDVISCTNGTYGENCTELCSPNCAGKDKACQRLNGRCKLGCVSGYQGANCDTAVTDTGFKWNLFTVLIIGSLLVTAVLFCVLLSALLLERKDIDEGEQGEVSPVETVAFEPANQTVPEEEVESQRSSGNKADSQERTSRDRTVSIILSHPEKEPDGASHATATTRLSHDTPV